MMINFWGSCKRYLGFSNRSINQKFSLSNSCPTTMDGTVFEVSVSKTEPVPELNVSNSPTPKQLLEQVTAALKDKPALLHREFVQTKPGNERHSFRVMTWNWLAQSLSSGKDNFVRCPAECLKWEFRRLRLVEEILRVDPDVLCMQEVDHYGFISPLLEKLGYKGSFFPKPDSPCSYAMNNNGPDGCAMFYKSSVFDVKHRESLILHTDVNSHPTNQVSVVYTLQLKSEPQKDVTIATTHLKAKKGWEDLRLQQGRYLVKYLEDKVQQRPLIICGDFNAEPSEAVYKVYSSCPLDLGSAYTSLSKPFDQEPAYTTWKVRGNSQGGESEVCHTIDYIWYTRPTLAVRGLLSMPTEEDIGVDRLPSFRYPSDHLSLAADFDFV